MRNRAVIWSALLAVGLAAFGCKGKDGGGNSKTEPAARPPEPAEPAVPAFDGLAAARAWTAVATAKDTAALPGLYAENASVIPASSGMTLTGPARIAQFFSQFWTAMPDLTYEPYLALASGHRVATVGRTRGTNSNGLMGAPATNKQTSFLGLSIAEYDEAGAIQTQTLYADNLSFMGQLGIWDGPHRAYDTSAAPAPRQAAAADSDAERANVALVENALSAFNAHDAVALAALYAPDAVLADQSAADDATGDAIAAAYKGLFASFPDAQKTEHVVWGAGDWVVSTYRLTGTNQGPLERLGLSEGSGKAIDLQVGDVIRVADGAIAEHWIFADGMAVGIQLGALQLPGM